MDIQTLPVMLVVWDDACMTGHWQDNPPAPPEEELVTSVGFLVHKTDKHIVLIQTASGEVHGNSLQIPRGMIKKMIELPLPKSKGVESIAMSSVEPATKPKISTRKRKAK